MKDFFTSVTASARFAPDRASKVDLVRGSHLFAGLNCFEAGQRQAVHAHDQADKFYFLVAGKARMTVGNMTRDVAAGELVWAPAGIPHGVEEALERTVMLVAMSPGP